MKSIIFGAGKYLSFYWEYLKNLNIVALVDNDENKQGKDIYGHTISPPDILNNIIYDRIYICSIHCNEIRKQLLQMGINDDKIYFYFDLCQNKDDYIFLPNSRHGKGKKIALISHEFSTTGAANCLLSVAKYLQIDGYHVIIGSPYDGAIRKDFQNIGAEIYIDKRLRMGNLSTIEWVEQCDFIFVNTILLYYLLRGIKKEIPIIWWLHEPISLYKSVVLKVFNEINYKNINIYSVSAIADLGIKKLVKNIKINRLLFGVEDDGNINWNTKKDEKRLSFIIIGSVSKLKGHDIFVKALSIMDRKYIRRIKVVFIGNDTSIYACKLKDDIKKYKLPIEFKGCLSHNQTLSNINKSDVLICASREETMSVVVAEAMMLGKCSIVSSNAGVAEFITDKENGYIFESGNAYVLADKIKYLLNNQEDMCNVCKNSRKTYEKIFSMEKYYKSLDSIFI